MFCFMISALLSVQQLGCACAGRVVPQAVPPGQPAQLWHSTTVSNFLKQSPTPKPALLTDNA